MRQSLAGMLWSKQFYHYVVKDWLEGDEAFSAAAEREIEGQKHGLETSLQRRRHFDARQMGISVVCGVGFGFSLRFRSRSIDSEFAKHQLILLLREWYMHPNGQIPAYEWAFSDVNPPVHAWAALRVYQIEAKRTGTADREFLEKIFHKLLLEFYVVGQSQRRRKATMFLKADFSAWTISAFSTATRNCRPADISNNRTALRGWRCIV